MAVSIAGASAAHLEQYLDSLDAIAAAALQHPGVTALEAGCCHELFTQLLSHQPLLTNIVLTDREGAVRAVALPSSSAAGQIARAWIANVAATGKPVISDWYKGQVSGKPVVTLGYPVRAADESVAGALGLSIDLSRLQMVFAKVPLPAGSVITLLDRSGLVLARSADAERFIGTTMMPPADAAAGPPRITGEPDGVERITALGSIRRGPWFLSVAIPRTVVRESLFPLWTRHVLIIGASAFALIGLGMLIAWQTTLHVNRLRSAAEQIADGDLSPPARIPSPNRDFSLLQDAFIRMAGNLRETRDALDRQVEQERKMNETVHSLERQVVRQERLAAVGVLVSGVAHELNNPLQAILGTAELLERQPGMSPDALDEISFLKTQSGRAREIIRNLSRFSSQQSGPPTPVDLRDVVAEVVQLRRGDLDSSGVALVVEVTSARKVHANFTELEQVTLNFVINAQQSIESLRAERGRIVMRVSDAGKRVRLEVLDNGAGVDPPTSPSCSSRSSRPSRSARERASACPSATASSIPTAAPSATNATSGAARPSSSSCPPSNRAIRVHDPSAVLHRSI